MRSWRVFRPQTANYQRLSAHQDRSRRRGNLTIGEIIIEQGFSLTRLRVMRRPPLPRTPSSPRLSNCPTRTAIITG